MHILAADGCFGDDGFFYAPSINIDIASLEKLFIYKIFKMLLSKGLILPGDIPALEYIAEREYIQKKLGQQKTWQDIS